MSQIRSSHVHRVIVLALTVLLAATVLLGAVIAGDAVAPKDIPTGPRG